MSTNIHMYGIRDVQVVKTGKIEQQRHKISVWQTPTLDSYAIAKAADPVAAYIKWVEGRSYDQEEPVYADDDVFHEGEPIGSETFNPGKEHIADLLKIIAALKEEGYDIVVEVW